MKDRNPNELSPEEIRGNALASAIMLRDCSLRAQTTNPTRRICRTMMRAQAIKWRQPPAENGTQGNP